MSIASYVSAARDYAAHSLLPQQLHGLDRSSTLDLVVGVQNLTLSAGLMTAGASLVNGRYSEAGIALLAGGAYSLAHAIHSFVSEGLAEQEEVQAQTATYSPPPPYRPHTIRCFSRSPKNSLGYIRATDPRIFPEGKAAPQPTPFT